MPSSPSPPPLLLLRTNINIVAAVIIFFASASSWCAESFSPQAAAATMVAPKTRSATTTRTTTTTTTMAPRPVGIVVGIHGNALSMSSAEASTSMTMGEQDDDDDMEWVEEEFELLTERDFYNTEWKIGTLMDDKPRDPRHIDTTWARLVTTEDGTNSAVWGDGSRGKWTIDVPSQFFSISKESFGGWLGKRIWAGTINDFYYLEGTVRGWSPLSPASVVGGWQAIRLGVVDGARVTEEERGGAPWFETPEDEEEEEEEEEEKEVEVEVEVEEVKEE